MPIAAQRTRSPAVRFDEWLRKAKRGESFVYFIGTNLAHARTLTAEVDEVASRAWSAFKRGEVLLTQKVRVGPILGFRAFAYTATRTRNRTHV